MHSSNIKQIIILLLATLFFLGCGGDEQRNNLMTLDTTTNQWVDTKISSFEESNVSEVKISIAPFGSGSIIVSKGEISFDSSNTPKDNTLYDVYLNDKSELIFEATPSKDSEILRWDGCDKVSIDGTKCVVTQNRDREVFIYFGYKETTLVDNITNFSMYKTYFDNNQTIIIPLDGNVSQLTDQITIGDYVVSDNNDTRYLKEIISIESNATAVRYTTKAAGLEDIVIKGTLYRSEDVFTDENSSTKAPSRFFAPTATSTPESKAWAFDGGVNIKVSGDATVTPSWIFYWSKSGVNDSPEVSVGVRGDAKFDFTTSVEGTFSASKVLFSPSKTIAMVIGTVPVWVDVTFEGKVGVNLAVSGKVDFNSNLDVYFEAYKYASANTYFLPVTIYNSGANPTASKPETQPEVEGSVKLSFNAELSVLAYSAVGGKVNAEPFASATIKGCYGVSAEAGIAFGVNAGLYTPPALSGFFNYELSVGTGKTFSKKFGPWNNGKCECNASNVPTPQSGVVEMFLTWGNENIDMDLSVGWSAGSVDVKNTGCPMEHFYIESEHDIYPGTYPVYVNKSWGSQEDLPETVSLSIKVPGKSETHIVTATTVAELDIGHAADIKVYRDKTIEPDPTPALTTNNTYNNVAVGGGWSGGSSSGSSGGGYSGGYSLPSIATPVPNPCEGQYDCGCKPCLYDIIWYMEQALLGPLSGANIALFKASEYPSGTPIYQGLTSTGDTVYTAGIIDVPESITDALEDDEAYVLEIRGGKDIDVNDDFVADAIYTDNYGTIRSVVMGKDIKYVGYKVNILTEIAYQVSKDLLTSDHETLFAKLDEVAENVLIGKIYVDSNKSLNHNDLAVWLPTVDKDLLIKEYASTLKPIVDKIYDNIDISSDAYDFVYTPKYNEPTLKSTIIYVNENTVSTEIGSVRIINEGDGVITSMQLSGTGSENFTVTAEGVVSVVSDANLDYEVTEVFTLNVKATNVKGTSKPVKLYVQLRDVVDAPRITGFVGGNIEEDAKAGSGVGKINFDEGQSSITSIQLLGNGAEKFNVALNGQITLGENALLDYEKQNSFTFDVSVTNSHGSSRSAKIVIHVLDIPDTPQLIGFNTTLYFTNVVDSIIGRVGVVTSGSAPIESFVLVGGDKQYFSIDNLGYVRLIKLLDPDKNVYIFTVTGVNRIGESVPVQITVNVATNTGTETPCIPIGQSFSGGYLNEGAKPGVEVGSVFFSPGCSDITSYKIEGSSEFIIDASGQIVVADGAILDYETKSHYSLKVIATNNDGESQPFIVSILLNDVIDQAPIIEPLVLTIDEDTLPRVKIGSLTLVSSGESEASEYTFYGENADYFSVDRKGDIYTTDHIAFDDEKKSVYLLNVKARNYFGSGALVQVEIHIDNVDKADAVTFNGTAAKDIFFSGTGDDTIIGNSGNDLFHGGNGNDQITTLNGHDEIHGGAGNDVIDSDGNRAYYVRDNYSKDILDGGEGNDTLYGGEGNDQYYYKRGDGRDLIYDSVDRGGYYENRYTAGSGDILRFTGGITPENLILKPNGEDLIVGIKDGSKTLEELSDVITIKKWYHGYHMIETFMFDSSSMNVADIKAATLALTVDGTDGNDTLTGSGGNDTITGGYGVDIINASGGDDIITGGAGNDILNGGAGNDTYHFMIGDGQDTITDGAGSDKIVFGAGITKDDLIMRSVGTLGSNTNSELVLGIKEAGATFDELRDKITFHLWHYNAAYRVDTFEFDDGTVMTTDDIVSAIGTSDDDTVLGLTDRGVTIYSGAGWDTIMTGVHNDTIYGESGSDTISAGDGHDILDGGPGEDTLKGGWGNDTYIVSIGGGKDTIYDTRYENSNADRYDGGSDVLKFIDDINASSLEIYQSGDDLLVGIKEEGKIFDQYRDVITIQKWFMGVHKVETFKFDDNSTMNATQIESASTFLN